MTKTITIQDGPRKVKLDRAIWNQCFAYMAEKSALWDRFRLIPDNDPAWDGFNAARNQISTRYQAIFNTPEYSLALTNEITPLLNRMAGLCAVCGSAEQFDTGACALCGK